MVRRSPSGIPIALATAWPEGNPRALPLSRLRSAREVKSPGVIGLGRLPSPCSSFVPIPFIISHCVPLPSKYVVDHPLTYDVLSQEVVYDHPLVVPADYAPCLIELLVKRYPTFCS